MWLPGWIETDRQALHNQAISKAALRKTQLWREDGN